MPSTSTTHPDLLPIRQISIREINTDQTLQMRVGPADSDQLANLAEAYRTDPAAVPPIDVFRADTPEGDQPYYIGDGWHRYYALLSISAKMVTVRIHPGGYDAAYRHALGANAAHGLRRTNADKRNAVECALAKWPNWSNRRIAEVCKVSDMSVKRIRDEVQQSCTCRVGADGKTYPVGKKEPEQVDFWDLFRRDLGSYIGNIELARTNGLFGARMMAEPDRAAQELEATADALAHEVREMRHLAKSIRQGQADKRKGGAV